MQNYFPILRNCPLFAEIADESLGGMLGCLGATAKKYEKNEIILAEGDPATRIGILLSGSATVLREDYDGDRHIVSEVAPAELFGEAFACAETILPVSVVATETAEVLLIDCRRILHTCCNACAFHERTIYNLMKILAEKNLQMHKKAEILAKRTTREKLLAYLAQTSRQCGSRYFTIPFDRQELADYLEVDRSGLSVEISKLRAEGIIDCHKSDFKLL